MSLLCEKRRAGCKGLCTSLVMKGRHGLKVGIIAKVDEAGRGGREQCLGIFQTEHYKSCNRQLIEVLGWRFFVCISGYMAIYCFFLVFVWRYRYISYICQRKGYDAVICHPEYNE